MMIQAINGRDTPTVMGCIVLLTVCFSFVNLIVDTTMDERVVRAMEAMFINPKEMAGRTMLFQLLAPRCWCFSSCTWPRATWRP